MKVENQFQSSPFECNLQRYTTGLPDDDDDFDEGKIGSRGFGLLDLGRALHVVYSTDPPPPRLIGWNMCRPIRRLNAVCVGQSEGCIPQLASLHLGSKPSGKQFWIVGRAATAHSKRTPY